MTYPKPIQDLIEQFRRLPGVGPKTAERFVFHLLRGEGEQITALLPPLAALRGAIERCTACGTFTEGTTCGICGDLRRDHGMLCVVSDPSDILAVERTGEYRGVYHVLGGLLAPIEGIGPEELRIATLTERVRDGITEIIFAFDPTIEGETTVN